MTRVSLATLCFFVAMIGLTREIVLCERPKEIVQNVKGVMGPSEKSEVVYSPSQNQSKYGN